MSKWWDEDMSMAGQGLYADPNTAVQVATLPSQLLAAQELQKRQAADPQQQQDSRGGFMKNLIGGLTSIGKGVDDALSNIPGYGVAKQAAYWPVDKTATGMRWVYSEALSRPLSTLFLESAKAESGGYSSFLKGSDWTSAYDEAKNVSPGQAVVAASTAEGIDNGQVGLVAHLAGVPDLSVEDRQKMKQQADRFMYDSDYWRNKAGWKYTVGTGAMDFGLNMFDPTYAGVKYGAQAIKAARSTKLVGEGEKLRTTSGVVGDITKEGKTAQQVSESERLNKFYDWADGKSAAAIRAHPVWGKGRRVNPFADQYSEVLSRANRDDMPLVMRFAAGDADALPALNQSNEQLVIQMGKMNENRTFLQSLKYNADIAKYFAKEEEAGRTIGAGSTGITKKGNVVEPPTPRPAIAGPERDAWDKAWGKTAQAAEFYRTGAKSYLASKAAIPAGDATNSTAYKYAKQWKSDQLDIMEREIADHQAQDGAFALLLGPNAGKGIDDFSPGESNLFGTLKTLYRMGPLALKDTERAADITYMNRVLDRSGRKAIGGNIASRLLRQGYYSAPLRVLQSVGDRTPQGLVNHTDADAADRVSDMLKQVPGLGAEARMGMLDSYSKAYGKIQKQKVLDDIHTNITARMVGRYGNLDQDAIDLINRMRTEGWSNVMNGLGGKQTSEMFSATKAPEVTPSGGTTMRRVDLVEDGEGYMALPLLKTQLSNSSPLMPVKEFDRFLSRSNGFFAGQKKAGLAAKDGIVSVADLLNTTWKASTLLRPGYILRAPSDEMALRGIKFGMFSLMADGSQGGWNWMRNRGHQMMAIAGKGDYVPSSGKGLASNRAIVNLDDTYEIAKARSLGLEVKRIRVNKALPIVQGRIRAEVAEKEESQRELDSLSNQMEKYKKQYGDTGVEVNKKGKYLSDEIKRLSEKIEDHDSTINEHLDYQHAILSHTEDAVGNRLGDAGYSYKGIPLHGAFSKDWENPIPRAQVTSDDAASAVFARGESIDASRLIKTGSWKAIKPTDPNHMEEWLHVLNHQFGQDELVKMIAGDPSLAKPIDWVHSAAGKDHLRSLGRLGEDPDNLVQAIKITLDDYLPEGTGLQQKLANGEDVLEGDLRKAIHKDDFPNIHGEETKPLTRMFAKSSATRFLDDLIAKAYKRIGTIPSDIMSRHPLYVRAQQARMRELIDQELAHYEKVGKSADSIDVGTLNKMQQKSHQMAMKDLTQIAYDPARTTATEALRFFTPFLSAFQDGLQRWGGMIAEKPEFVNSASKIYNAPVAANLITDQDGNHVGMDGYSVQRDQNGKIVGRTFVPIEKRILNLKLPGDAQNRSALKVIPGYGHSVSLSAMNTILPGDPWFNPGAGPLVQVAGFEIAKKSPVTGDFLQWAKVLPYGPSGSISDAVTPKYMRQIYEAYTADDPDNTKYQKAYLDVYNKYVAESRNGGPPVDLKKVEHDAKKFMWLQALTSWATPAQFPRESPLTGTPYQFYVDQYKKLQQVDPQHAQDQFLQRYGSDYFQFTSALTKSIGIAPTQEAMLASEEYKDLIAQDPDMAGFLTMTKSKGKFSASVYQKQLGESIGGERVRTFQSAQDAIRENQKDLGWAQYNKIKLVLDSVLLRSGFKSYTQKGAEGLLQAKRQIVASLGQKFPEWDKDFHTTDSGAVSRRIQEFQKLVASPKLANDPMRTDVPVLAAYLERRAMYKSILQRRGAVGGFSMTEDGKPTGDNADIGLMWQQEQTNFMNSDTLFNQVFNRYLSNDTLQ